MLSVGEGVIRGWQLMADPSVMTNHPTGVHSCPTFPGSRKLPDCEPGWSGALPRMAPVF